MTWTCFEIHRDSAILSYNVYIIKDSEAAFTGYTLDACDPPDLPDDRCSANLSLMCLCYFDKCVDSCFSGLSPEPYCLTNCTLGTVTQLALAVQ